ncbi:hypothetical protein HKX48_001345 [Thoreauomyces humboldtii]|nr:hypothetical protein HKX48_001345 [Thoreauomyces humboldtii]
MTQSQLLDAEQVLGATLADLQANIVKEQQLKDAAARMASAHTQKKARKEAENQVIVCGQRLEQLVGQVFNVLTRYKEVTDCIRTNTQADHRQSQSPRAEHNPPVPPPRTRATEVQDRGHARGSNSGAPITPPRPPVNEGSSGAATGTDVSPRTSGSELSDTGAAINANEEDQTRKLRKQVVALQHELARQDQETVTLAALLKEAEDWVRDDQKKAKKFVKAKEELEVRLANVTRELEDTQRLASDQRAEIESAWGSASVSQMNEYEDHIQELKREKAVLIAQVNACQTVMGEYEGQIENLARVNETRLAEIARLQSVAKELKLVEEEKSTLCEKLEMRNASLDALESEHGRLIAFVSELQEKLSVSAQTGPLEPDMSTADDGSDKEHESKKLNADLAAAMLTIADLQKQIEAASLKNGELAKAAEVTHLAELTALGRHIETAQADARAAEEVHLSERDHLQCEITRVQEAHAADVQKLNAIVTGLEQAFRAEVAKLNDVITEQKVVTDAIRAELAESRQVQASHFELVKTLKAEKAAGDLVVADLEQGHQAEVGKLTDVITEQKAMMDAITAELTESRRVQASHSELVKTLKAQKAAEDVVIADLEQDHQAEVAKLTAVITEQKAQMDAIRAELAESRQVQASHFELAAGDLVIADLEQGHQAEVGKLTDVITEQKAQMDAIRAELAESREVQASHSERVKTLEAHKAAGDVVIADLEQGHQAAVGKLTDLITEQKAVMDAITAELTESRQVRASHTEHVKTLEAQKAAADVVIADLEQTQQAEIIKLTEVITEQKASTDAIIADLEQAQQVEVANLKEVIGKQKGATDAIIAELERAQQLEITKLKEDLETQRATASKASDELKETNTRLKQATRAVMNLNADRLSLHRRVEQLEGDLGAAKQEADLRMGGMSRAVETAIMERDALRRELASQDHESFQDLLAKNLEQTSLLAAAQDQLVVLGRRLRDAETKLATAATGTGWWS